MSGTQFMLISRAWRSAQADPSSAHCRRHALIAMVLAALLLAWLTMLLTPAAALAAEIRYGDAVVVVPGETIDDDLYAFGQTVTIQGTVNGDVIAAGQSVNIGGRVNGDLMAAGSTVTVNGSVTGAARLAGQSIDVGAPIGNDLLAGAATIDISPQASVGRDVLVGGQTVTLGGPVERSIRVGAERLTIGGPVGGDVLARVGTLRLGSGAHVQGSVTYTSSQDAVVEPGATIKGTTTRFEAPDSQSKPSPAARFGAGALAWLQTLVGLSVFGLVLVLLFPGFISRSTETLAGKPWPSLGLGFAVLVGVPIVAALVFVVGLAIGGWWIGPLLLAVYLGTLPAGYTMAGLFVGRYVMEKIGRPQAAMGWHLLVGLVLFGLVSLVPIVGGMTLFGILLLGLGASVATLTAIYREHFKAEGGARPPEMHVEERGEPIAAR